MSAQPSAVTPAIAPARTETPGSRHISLTRFLIEEKRAGHINPDLRLLEIAATELHQRLPVFMGSRNEVETATRHHLDADAAGAPSGVASQA